LAAFQYGYGFTDLVRRPTASAKYLSKAEKREGASELIGRLNEIGDRPPVVFHFKDAWDFAAEPLIKAGYSVFKMPGPYAKKEVVDAEMKELMKRLKNS
jgi:hypothetical protein